MSDVLLVYPPSYFSEQQTRDDLLKNYSVGKTKIGVWPPLGQLYIAAMLKKKGISVDFLDAFLRDISLPQLLRVIEEKKVKIVGIAVTTLQVRAAVQIAEAVKGRFGDAVKVGIGGPHVSIDHGFVERFPCFDFAVSGEAEITFPKVAERILAGEKVKKLHIGELPQDLDALPLPARELIDIKDYFPMEEPYLSLVTMRGCPYNCIFCSRVAVSDKVRYRTPSLVVDEIELIMRQMKLRSFVFLDDTFTLNKAHTAALCREIIRRKLNISWSCNTRANTVDLELLTLMKQAGCHLILIGVETGDEQFRNATVKKKISDAHIRQMRAWCRKLKIPLGCYLMLGFPGETKENIEKTVSFAVKFKMDLMSIHTTTVYPGSEMHAIVNREGEKDLTQQWDRYARGEMGMDDLSLMYIPKGLTLKDLQKARKKAYMKFYFRPLIIGRQLLTDIRSWNNLKRDAATALQLLRHGRTSKDFK